MKIIHFLSIFSCFFAANMAFAQEKYKIDVDLNAVQDDKIFVTVHTPKISAENTTFIFPAVIPGSYSRKDFGRFIENFTAYNAEGKKLKVKKDKNFVYHIKKANQIAKITYFVNDTWDDTEHKDNFIFQPGGTNIEAGKNFVINHQGFWGYFDNLKMMPYEIHVTKPENFFGATALDKKSENSTKDIYNAPNYVRLVDSPIMYSAADTASFMVDNMKVRVAVFSDGGQIHADYVKEIIKPLGDALGKFFGKLPVNQYDFIMYFANYGSKITLNGGFGALEHSYSSFYFIPEMENEILTKTIRDISAHEFLHILTPLNIHSEEIEFFDFQNPKMSQHLWLYEGVTEYFSVISQTQNGLMDMNGLYENIMEKFKNAEKYKNVSFTDMSKNILTEKYKDDYNNVYYKGALLALCLDIRLHELTENKKSLKSVLLELSKTYGANKPFKDDAFIDEFVAISHPDMRKFFADYVQGANPLPYSDIFYKIGLIYKDKFASNEISFGELSVNLDPVSNELFFANAKAETNVFGIQANDVLIKINDVALTATNYETAFAPFSSADENTNIRVVVRRGKEELVLNAKPKLTEVITNHYFRVVKDIPADIKARRDAVFGNTVFKFEE